MNSLSQQNLRCSVCRDIFQDPVLLSCSHSFCKACLETWWTEHTNMECPVCGKRTLQSDPPTNLALRNVCEDFLLGGNETALQRSESRCSLHSEILRLFCLNDQQQICVVCLYSEMHKNHIIKPIDEAARENKEELQQLLEPLENKLELLTDMKENLDQGGKDIEAQAEDTEKQIKDVFSKFWNVLQKEEKARIDALRAEKQQKSEMMRIKSEALNKEIEALSDIIAGTNEVLRAEDLVFLQKYNTAAELVHCFLLNDPQQIPGAMIDVDKHLKDLPLKILERMQMKLTQRTADPEATVFSSGDHSGTAFSSCTSDGQVLSPNLGSDKDNAGNSRY